MKRDEITDDLFSACKVQLISCIWQRSQSCALSCVTERHCAMSVTIDPPRQTLTTQVWRLNLKMCCSCCIVPE
jgi:hypothetical protein